MNAMRIKGTRIKVKHQWETDVQCNPRKAMEPHLSRLYHQATISPGIWQNGTFYSHNGENISRRTRKTVLRSYMEVTWTSRKYHIR